MKRTEQTRGYVILDSDGAKFKRFLGSAVYLCRTQAEIAKVYDEACEDLIWVSYRRRLMDDLLKTVTGRRTNRRKLSRRRHECILTIAPPRLESVPALHGLFSRVVGDSPGYRWLPKDELSEVLFDPSMDRSEFIIAVAADPVTRALSLVRGDCQPLVVRFSLFQPSGDGTKPDFSKVRVTDFGRTLALGDYEASADAILYEMDPEYRKRMNLRRKQNEKSFGASLLRLRKQRRVKRSDFSPLSAKTIARIERNEIDNPHGATLQSIAERLGVAPEEIGEY